MMCDIGCQVSFIEGFLMVNVVVIALMGGLVWKY